jgi:hypothetical protein
VFLHGKKGLGKKNRKGWHCDKNLVHLKKFEPTFQPHCKIGKKKKVYSIGIIEKNIIFFQHKC